MELISNFFAAVGSFIVGLAIVVSATVAIGFAIAFVACQVMEIFKLKNDAIANNSGLLGALFGFVWSLGAIIKVGIGFAFFSSIGVFVVTCIVGFVLMLVAESRRPAPNPEFD